MTNPGPRIRWVRANGVDHKFTGGPPHQPARSLAVVALTCDVLVIGGGPAGSAAAITLARAGRDVVLADKATFPRDKCCGDGLTTLALRLLEGLGLDPLAVPSWFDVSDVMLRSPTGFEVKLPLPAGSGRYAAVTPRIELDHALVDLARAGGVQVYDGHGFAGFAAADSASSVGVELDGIGVVTSRYVVAADGMWSPVRRALGVANPGYLGEWHAFRQYASGVTGAASEQLMVWFDADLLPGYAWSFPLPGGRANVGFGVLRDGTRRVQEMKALWPDLLAREHVRAALGPTAVMEGRHTAWPIPARVDQAVTGVGRVLLAGDAIAAADPMTGEGIAQALLTGIEAARAIEAAGALVPGVARDSYRAAVHHHLVTDHRCSLALSRVLAHPLGARGALRLVSWSGDWGRSAFARWMFEDEPRALAVTPSRWHRNLFRRPGAFTD